MLDSAAAEAAAAAFPEMAAAAARAKELAVAVGKFIDSTPTPFHLCAQSAELLRAAGFVELVETEAWRPLLKPGGNYFYVRGGTLVAFAIGAGFVSGGGFSIIGAHTDSPVLKLKPCSKRSGKGYQQVTLTLTLALPLSLALSWASSRYSL